MIAEMRLGAYRELLAQAEAGTTLTAVEFYGRIAACAELLADSLGTAIAEIAALEARPHGPGCECEDCKLVADGEGVK